MNILSDRILSLEESQTIAMTRKSRELIDAGVDVISLSLGEPDFSTPDFIKAAAKEKAKAKLAVKMSTKRATIAKKALAKKVAVKKAPVKKVAAKKVPAKKSAAKKTPVAKS